MLAASAGNHAPSGDGAVHTQGYAHMFSCPCAAIAESCNSAARACLAFIPIVQLEGNTYMVLQGSGFFRTNHGTKLVHKLPLRTEAPRGFLAGPGSQEKFSPGEVCCGFPSGEAIRGYVRTFASLLSSLSCSNDPEGVQVCIQAFAGLQDIRKQEALTHSMVGGDAKKVMAIIQAQGQGPSYLY